MTHSELCQQWSLPPDGLEDQLYYEDNQLQNHIHKNSSIHSYFRQLRHILELKNKKMKKITPKKSSLFSILFFLELLSENPEEPNHQDPQPTNPNPNISFASIQWECSTSCYRCQPFFAQELCRLPNWISVVGWNRQARLNGSPGVQHPHNVNQASEKTSRKLPLAYREVC